MKELKICLYAILFISFLLPVCDYILTILDSLKNLLTLKIDCRTLDFQSKIKNIGVDVADNTTSAIGFSAPISDSNDEDCDEIGRLL